MATDEEAGAALIAGLATPKAAGSAAPPTDADEAAGMALVHAIGKPAESAVVPGPPTGGIARNVAAGTLDAAGNVANTVADPVGNLIGKPLATAAVFAHDALAPYLGYQRFDDATRNMLLSDNVPQPGTQAINALAAGVGARPDAVTADTPQERLAREVTGGALSVGALGPAGIRGPIMGAAGAAAGDVAAEQAPDWAKPAAALAGNVLGGGLAAPASALLERGGNALAGTGGGLSPEVAQLAKLARDKYDIPIDAPHLSPNSMVRLVADQSAKLPFSGADKAAAVTQEAWQRAVSKQMGEDAPLVTPEVMSRAANRIGGVFNDVAKRTDIKVDDPMLKALGNIHTEAASAPLGAGGHDAIGAQIDNIMEAAAKGDGKISGTAYQQLTRAGSPLQRAESAADPNVRYYAGQVRNALDAAFERSASPDDKTALTQARSQWRAMKTIEDLVEKSPDGNLSPALLMGQVRNASSRFDGSTGGMAYTGGGNLGDLARIGQQFLKTPPNSGTADRALVNALLGGGAVSAAIASPSSLLYAPAGLAANRVAGAYLRSNNLANRLIDSSMRPQPGPRVGMAPAALLSAPLGNNALRQN